MTATLEQSLVFRDVPAGNDLRELVPNPRVILDCGAGAGWFAKSAFTIWPKLGQIHSFEPASRFNLSLQPVNERHHIHRVALGEIDGDRKLYNTHGPESNSLLEFLPGSPLHKIHAVVGFESVECRTLDELITDGKDCVDLLKMDVQGAELMVLQGAKELIAASRPVIYCEVAFQPAYQNQPLLETVDDYLSSIGYKRLYLYKSPMPDLWGDAIYIPNEMEVGGPVRLNIGAGDTVIPGFTAIDRKFGTEAFPLNYADNSVDEIRCVHMLEHLSFRDVNEALKEWNRVLKPGGRLRISVPDIDKVYPLSTEKEHDPRWRFYLMGGQTDENDFHKSVFDHAYLQTYLEAAGFNDVKPWTSANTDLAAAPFSLNLEGFKGRVSVPPVEQDVKVRAVIGMPRIGWNDSWQAITDAMRPFGIPIETHQGCFWWQNVQAAMVRAQKDGIDWLICLDYDSMILPIHVNRLLEILGTRPDIDAIASLQMRRGAETPLFSTGKTVAEIDGSPIQVNTAHFGLTVLRVECLANMPKPWLIDVPDKNGEFSGDHTDADITFWVKWKEAGHTVFVAPDVRIGHLELLVSEFDDNYEAKHYQVGKWWNNHAQAGHCMRTTKEG
jgi:FkbM family methyltransferase